MGKRGQNVFCLIPSARGVHPDTVWNVFTLRTELEAHGHKLHGMSVYRMPLDLARNELACAFLSTTADAALLLDDDVQLGEGWVVAMLESGLEVVSAPCRMRSEGHLFNVVPTGAPFFAGDPEDLGARGPLRVLQCAWTGLGAVLVRRNVFERLTEVAPADQKYRSVLMPDRTSANLFGSRIDPAGQFDVSRPSGENVFSLDDKAFSLRLHEAGFRIHAAIDVPTVHDGMRGCFAEELEKVERLRKNATYGKPNLVGPNGERL